MASYCLKRLLHLIPLLFGITLLGFIVLQLAPGDYYTQLKLNPQIPPEVLEDLRERFGLDQPIIIQYFKWLQRVISLDFGESFAYHVPVKDLILQRLGNTLYLSIVALILTWLIAIPIGVWCATHQYRLPDKIFAAVAFVSMSLPTFFIAFLLVFFAATTGILPTGGMTSYAHHSYSLFGKVLDYLKHLIIPVATLVASSTAALLRLMRGYMIEELKAPYVLYAKAKGLPPRSIKYKHALKNAINPMITIFGYQLSDIFSGAALTEIITRWPGLGRLMLEAYLAQDLYVVMAALLMGAVMVILANLIADILLAIADPRIRLR